MPSGQSRAHAANSLSAAWQVDLDVRLALHLSGFAVRFSTCTDETCPPCCMMVKHGGQTWRGCPDGVPLELAPDELHDWVRQGAYAFLAALHAAGAGHVI